MQEEVPALWMRLEAVAAPEAAHRVSCSPPVCAQMDSQREPVEVKG